MENMNKVLVTGASGFIGANVVGRLSTRYHVLGTYNNSPKGGENPDPYHLDITDKAETQRVIREIKPECIVHCAAIGTTSQDQYLTRRVNVEGTRNIVDCCLERGIKLVFLSTDFVFDGNLGRYREDAVPNPIEGYGQTKHEAETAVGKAPRHCIVRTSLVYGWETPSQHPNFVTRLIQEIRSKRNFKAFTDIFRTPSALEDILLAIERIIDLDHSGIAHVAPPDYVNMYDFAQRVADIFELDKSYILLGNSLESERERGKPKKLGLDSKATQGALGIRFRNLLEGLDEMKSSQRK